MTQTMQQQSYQTNLVNLNFNNNNNVQQMNNNMIKLDSN
jgi:hypothetical protein